MKPNRAVSELWAAYQEWSHLIVNPNFIRSGDEITWKNCDRAFHRSRMTQSELTELAERKQYSFQFIDGSLLRIYYKYQAGDDDLERAALGFYRNLYPALDGEGAGDSLPTSERNLAIPWIRFDFDSTSPSSAVHGSTHLHLALDEGARVGVIGVPTPRQFVEAVIAWFYGTQYLAHRSPSAGGELLSRALERVNAAPFPVFDNACPDGLTHVRIPPLSR